MYSIELYTITDLMEENQAEAKSLNIEYNIITMNGPGCGNPVIELKSDNYDVLSKFVLENWSDEDPDEQEFFLSQIEKN